MRRKLRNVMLLALCGGCLFQGGCGGIGGLLIPLIVQVGGSVLFNSIISTILGPAQ